MFSYYKTPCNCWSRQERCKFFKGGQTISARYRFAKRVRLIVIGDDIQAMALTIDMLARGWSDVLYIPDQRFSRSHENLEIDWLYRHYTLRDLSQFSLALQEINFLYHSANPCLNALRSRIVRAPQVSSDRWLLDGFLFSYRMAIKRHLARWFDESSSDERELEELGHRCFYDVYLDLGRLRELLSRQLERLSRYYPELMACADYRFESLRSDQDGWRLFCQHKGRQESIQLSSMYLVISQPHAYTHALLQAGLSPEVQMSQTATNMYSFQSRPKVVATLVNRGGLRNNIRIFPARELIHVGFEHLSADDGILPNGKPLGFQQMVKQYGVHSMQDVLPWIKSDPEPILSQRYSHTVCLDSPAYLRRRSGDRPLFIGEFQSRRGLLLAMYNPSQFLFRLNAATVGDRLTKHFGEFRPAPEPDFWLEMMD